MLFPFVITLVLVVFLSCSSDDGFNGDGSSGGTSQGGSSSSNGGVSNAEWPFDSSDPVLPSTPGLAGLGLTNVIKIEYKDGSAPVTDNVPAGVSIEKTDENVVVTLPNESNNETQYNFVLSGTAKNGSLKIYGSARKGLYLNNVKITNNTGPAINIQGSKRAIVHLLTGTQNFLADGSNYSTPPNGEDAKGTFFSENKLSFEGSGSLEVKAKYKHGIVVDDDIEITNGKIIISEAVSDGIHANDIIEIKGGILKITSTGDAIQSEIAGKGIKITGGKIAATTNGIKSHGITSEESVEIDGNTTVIQISVWGNGSKGIKSSKNVYFLGGKTSIKVSGTKHTDNDDESTPSGIKTNTDLFIDNGELTIKSPGSEAKGISIDGDGTIKAGKTDIEADDDGIKVKGKLKIQGGTLSVKSKKKKAIDGSYDKNSCTPATGCNLVDGGF